MTNKQIDSLAEYLATRAKPSWDDLDFANAITDWFAAQEQDLENIG